MKQAIATLDQLCLIQVQLGDKGIIAAAPRGPGLDKLANITSCSRCAVAMLLGMTRAAYADRLKKPGLQP